MSTIDTGTDIIQTSDGGYAITGRTSYGNGNGDISLIKFDSAGTLSWSRTWGSAGNEEKGHALIQTSDGGYAVLGQAFGLGTGGYDAILVKFTSDGTLSWSRAIGGTAYDYGYAVVQTATGDYTITGDTKSYGQGNSDMFLANLSSTGSLNWFRTWGGTANEVGSAMVLTSDGGYAVTGYAGSFPGPNPRMFVAVFDSFGSERWSRTWGGSGDYPSDIKQTTDGGFVTTGYTSTYGAGNSDAYLVKYDPSGGVSWSRTWGTTATEYGNGVVQSPDGGYALIAGVVDVQLLKYDEDGTIAGCVSTQCQSPTVSTGTPTPVMATYAASVTVLSNTSTSPTTTNTSHVATATTPYGMAVWGKKNPLSVLPSAAQDTSGVSSRFDDPLRLRITLKNTKRASPSQVSMKLQVASRVGTCDLSFTGEAYVDVGGVSAPFAYYDNPGLTDAVLPTSSTSDPTVSGTLYYENYVESAPFTNRRLLKGAQYGMWDIALTPMQVNATNGSYCFRVVKSDNSTLVANYIAELNLSAPSPKQQLRHGKFLDTSTGEKQPFYW
jgi:hypothetical protein